LAMAPMLSYQMLLVISLLQSGTSMETETMEAFTASSSDSSTFVYTDDFPVPELGKLHSDFTNLPTNATEVLIKVFCSSVNPSDLSTDAYLKPKPLGSDVVGTIVAINGSSRFSIGDVVWGDIGANADLASDPTIVSKELGAYAQYAVALDTQLSLAPVDSISLFEACGLPKVALTTYKALVWYAGAPWPQSVGGPRSPRVLVLGGSGGTGSAAIQLAVYFGAASVATTTSSGNFDYCSSLGATQLIDYHTTDWQDVFQEGDLDIIFDTVGSAGTAADALALLSKSGGRFVTIAGALAPSWQVPAGTTQNNFINSDTNLASAPQLSALKDIVDAGGLAMPSISVYGLDQTSEAFATSKAGHVVGKLVISITNDTEVS